MSTLEIERSAHARDGWRAAAPDRPLTTVQESPPAEWPSARSAGVDGQPQWQPADDLIYPFMGRR